MAKTNSNFLEGIGLAAPAIKALTNAGFKCLEDRTKVSEKEIFQLHCMGPKGIERNTS